MFSMFPLDSLSSQPSHSRAAKLEILFSGYITSPVSGCNREKTHRGAFVKGHSERDDLEGNKNEFWELEIDTLFVRKAGKVLIC